jgi:2-polyprenyl-3-methyl-5-hydroxy-6-metoxy-1,4-benzoquinol methylase
VTTTATTTDEQIEAQVEGLVERLFMGGIAALEALTIHVGTRLGLYEALHEHGPCTSGGLADAVGIHERYAREWLEQQATAELVAVDNPGADPAERRYGLPPASAEVLLNDQSLAYLAPIGGFLVSFGSVFEDLLAAFRTGGGVPYGDYGAEMREAQGAFNRPAFTQLLASEWLAEGAPDVHARLQKDSARVLDVGCGYGWSTVALAQAFPRAQVVGVDVDEPSIDEARRHAKQMGVDDRVTFTTAHAADVDLGDEFDVVFVFEAVHDMSRPVEVLAQIRDACAADGTVIIMDENVAEEFGAIGHPVERFMYAASVVHCLPVGMAEQPSVATGTVMRPSTLRGYADDAGYASTEILPIEHDFFRFYRLEK